MRPYNNMRVIIMCHCKLKKKCNKASDAGSGWTHQRLPFSHSSVTIALLGGSKQAPMNRQMFGCRIPDTIFISAVNSSSTALGTVSA